MFDRAELEEALGAYERQGEGQREARADIGRAVRAFLSSPYGKCLRDRHPVPEPQR
ncbi:hypothetical protein [Algiphilus sp.]|uniref:hypothetical protein n=1 Tax=Algiphilus sp. TaxID=1872431 RepID=UPI003C606AFC